MSDEDATSKPNRRAKQEPKAHRQVMSKPMGLPKWERPKTRKERDRTIADVSKRARKSQATYGLERFAKDMGPAYDDTPICTTCGHHQSGHAFSQSGGRCLDCAHEDSRHEFSTEKRAEPKTVTGPSETPAPIPSKVPKTWAHLVSQKRYIPPHIADRAKVEQSPRSKEISHRAAVALKLRHQFHGTATDKMGKSEADECGCGHPESDHQIITSNSDPRPRIRCMSCYDDHPFSPDTVPLHVQRRNEEAQAQREFVPKTKRMDTIMGLHEKYRGSGHSVMDKSDAMFEMLDDKSPRYHGHEDPIGGKWVHQHDSGDVEHQHNVPRIKPNCCEHPAKDHDTVRDASTNACHHCDDDHDLTGARVMVRTIRHSPSGFKEDMVPDKLPKDIRDTKIDKSGGVSRCCSHPESDHPTGYFGMGCHNNGCRCAQAQTHTHTGGIGVFEGRHAHSGGSASHWHSKSLMGGAGKVREGSSTNALVPDKLPDDIQNMKSQSTYQPDKEP